MVTENFQAQAPYRRRDDDIKQQPQKQQQQHQHQHHHHLQDFEASSDAALLPFALDASSFGQSEAFPSMEEEKEEGRPLSMKRVRSMQDCTLTGLFLAQPPPPDCPPYLDGRQLPLWVGRTPVELTPEKVDELHNIQWLAWKEEGNSQSTESSHNQEEVARKDYARILEAAGSIFNASFVKLNPHNFSITVGITVDAMYHLQAPALACANTFLYGLSLLADNPSKQTIPIQFCKAAPVFMEEWAREAFGGGEGRQAGREEVVASLFEFCGVYPHSGLPDVLGKQVEKRVEELMAEQKNKEAKALIKRLFEAPWAQGHKVLDEDVYWKLRLLSYICKRRACLSSTGSPRSLSSPVNPSSPSSPSRGGRAGGKITDTMSTGSGHPFSGGPVVVKMVVLVFPSSSGRLPLSLEGSDAAGTAECGRTFAPEELEASLSSLQAAFSEFSESFLALSRETVQWELVLKRDKCVLAGACMPARRYHREVEASTNPNRLVAQADFERSREFAQWLEDEGREDKDVREAQAVLVVWPGLKAPREAYMLTCGGYPRSTPPSPSLNSITPYGGVTAGGRAVFMSDGPMLTGRPVWSPMWLWHETFHIMEHIFPEAPFAEASTLCGHPCFLRNQWPDHYEGQGYEWDYYFNSYRAHILHRSVQPSLAVRLSSISDLPRTRCFDLGRRETSRLIERLAHRGDRVLLRGSPCSSSSSGGGSSVGALAIKPGNLLGGLTFLSAVNEERKAEIQAQDAERGENKREEEEKEEEAPALMAFWVSEPPCFVITLVQGGNRAAHESVVQDTLAGESGRNGRSPRHQHQQQHHDSPLPPSSSPSVGNAGRMRAASEWVALVEEPRCSLDTDALVGYAEKQLQKCVEQGICTYRATGSSLMRQRYYACLSCREFSVLQGNVGCCLSCSKRCHKGHELVLREEGPFYCDCAIGGFSNMKCSCLGQGQGEEALTEVSKGHESYTTMAEPHVRLLRQLDQQQHDHDIIRGDS